MANQSTSKVASNLGFFISPKSEDESGYLKSQAVCKCVETKAKESLSKKEYESLEKELHLHAEKMNKLFEKNKFGIESLSISELSEPTLELQSKLKSILPLVSFCENEHDTEVEF